MSPTPDTAPPSGYAEALAELDGILGQLERSDVDVDVLAANVQRAAVLIAFCRERIGNARLQIEQVVAGLDEDD
ncbi:MAG: exodeoxyribonuclease VII small subunit [Acidimicrobiaceae bacterium]|nr:exodeoxyribonuclease VII small subunit [Ilumatobacter sp.]MCB9380665.1 exodeoxyribonuclease VII small subunit [Acidimicrobiaceae bacterium]MCO5329151.1 exodeoxyribonuclease VII small subunit [Ilumatobacteraceae bacterium]